MTYQPLTTANDTWTAEEVAALNVYAAKHGRTWKSKLRAAWMSGGNGEGTGGILRTIRNMHGPSGLNTLRAT